MIGVVGCQVLGTGLGFAAVAMTGQILPQDIIVTYAPGGIAIVIGLIFAFLAPWSTDITANTPPLIDILMATLRLRWRTAVVVAAVIGFFAAPWWAVGKAADYTNYMTAWAGNYGILLGPIAGVMIASFWINRKKTLDVQKLYTYGPSGYWYAGGWGTAAFLAMILTWVVCYIIAAGANIAVGLDAFSTATGSFMAFIGPVPFPGSVTWYPATVFSFLFTWWLQKAMKQ